MPRGIFFDGVDCIGGTKILLKEEDSNIFLEFGKNFRETNQYFEFPTIQPWCIEDYAKTDLIPGVKGLYRWSESESPIDGVIVSHAHADHYGLIPLLKEDTKVYAGGATKAFIDLRNESYSRINWDMELDHLNFETFRTGDNVEVGDEISFEPVHVDHSVLASYGFLLSLGGRKIAYTGDLRTHGHRPYLTEDFIDSLESSDVDALITEGTNISQEKETPNRSQKYPRMCTHECANENEVEEEAIKVVEATDGLVIAETNTADIDRVRSLWRVAERTGREFVMGSRLAYITYGAKFRIGIEDLPAPWNSSVWLSRHKDRRVDERVDERSDAFKYYRYAYEKKLIEKEFKGDFLSPADSVLTGLGAGVSELGEREKGYIEKLRALEEQDRVYWGEKRDEIRKTPNDFLMCTSNASKMLLELKSEGDFDCEFILSRSEPFTEEMEVSFDKLLNWLKLFGIKEYHQIHVSGHCGRRGLERIVDAADPEVLIPVHTENPELFREIHTNVKIVGKGEEVSL